MLPKLALFYSYNVITIINYKCCYNSCKYFISKPKLGKFLLILSNSFEYL